MSGAVWIFLQACVYGAMSGALYDLFRFVRLLSPFGRRMLFWQDGLFCLCIAGWIFRFTLRLLSGQLRLFVLIGWGLGFLLWYCTAGELVFGILRRSVGFFRRIFRKIMGFFAKCFRHFRAKKSPPLGHSA